MSYGRQSNSASKTGILVLGAGELGNAVIESLVHHPNHIPEDQAITVLVSPSSDPSNPSISAAKRSLIRHFIDDLNVRVYPFDLHGCSPQDLSTVLRPFHTIISCTGFGASPGLQKKIADCVLSESVPYFIPWQFGVDYDIIGKGSAQDLFTEQLTVREALRSQSKTKWNIVSVGVFMSFLFEPMFGVVDASDRDNIVVRALGGWDYELTATTAGDIGKCVAEIVLGKEENREASSDDGVTFLAGDTFSYRHLAKVVEDVVGKSVQQELWDLPYLKGELTKTPEDGLLKYRCIWADGVGVAWAKDTSFNARSGITMETVSEYASRIL